MFFYFKIMTRFEDLTNERLISIFDLLYKEPAIFTDFLKQNNNDTNKARQDIISQIKSGLKKTNYDGNINNSEAIYWFCKGLNQAAPKSPVKYQLNDNEMFEKVKSLLQKNKLARDDSDALSEIIKRRVSYKQYFTGTPINKQKEIVNKIMGKLKDNPTDWQIDFDLLTDEGKRMIFPLLTNFFKNIFSNIEVAQYKLQYNVGGEWHSSPLNPENINKLLQSFKEENFIFDMDNKPAEYFYEKDSMEFPEWSLFSSIKLSKLKYYR